MKKIAKKLLAMTLAAMMVVPSFIFPSSAETTTPETITSTSGYSNIEIRVTTDKEPLSYKVGDTVTFTMKVYADNVHVSVPQIQYTLEGDGDATHPKVTKTGTLYPDANGVFTLTENVIEIPGYMRITGDIYSANGTTKWAETPDDSRDYALAAGFFVDYENVYPVASKPDDFDAVWDARLAELDAVVPKIVRIDKVSKYYSTSTLKTISSSASYDVYAVYVDCIGCEDDILLSDDLGNEKGATWAVGYITVPKNKTAGSMGISQGFQGRGINTATPSTSTSAITINMSTHSVVLLNNDNAASSADFKTKYTSYVKGGSQYGTDAESNASLETCYWANMLLRDVQMLRFAKQAFGTEGAASLVDENTATNMTETELTTALEYWKGLYNGEISTSGGSQGGFQALCTAALEPQDVVSVNAQVPSMADNYINTDENRVHCNSRPAAGEALRYCETSFLASRITASVSITAGLNDKTCAPVGIMCIWNSLVKAHADDADYRASITFIQSKTHGYTPAYPENQAHTLYTYEQIEPEGIPNSEGTFTKSGYTDIDGYTVDQDAPMPSTGYIQVGTNDSSKATVADTFKPSLYFMTGANAYYNAETKKLVLVSKGTISDNYNYNTTTPTQNANVSGAIWRLGYWAKNNSLNINHVEFRYGTAGSQLGGIGYFTNQLTSVTSFKLDTRFTTYNWGGNNATTSIFTKMAALESAGHGTFAADGTFTAKYYADGVIDLRGFTGFSDSDFGYTNYNGYSVKSVITNKLSGANMFENCVNLTTVTVADTASLTSIGKDCFKGCNKLEEINIECTLSALTIGSNAFGGNAIIINVNTDADKAIVEAALTAASISNVTVLSAGEEPPVEPDEPEEEEDSVPPAGIRNTNASFTASGYTDIDGISGASTGYVQIGTKTIAEATVAEDFLPKLYYINGANVYYNSSTGKLVFVINSGNGKLTAAANTGVKDGQNQNVAGSVWYLVYWITTNSSSITDVEIRCTKTTGILNYIGYLTTCFDDVVSVKFDSKITTVTYSNKSSSGLFYSMPALETAGHGSFAQDGTFTPSSYMNGVVDLTGFTATDSANLAYVLYKSTSVKNVVTSVLPANAFNGCTGLTKVTLKNSDALASVGAGTFNGCSALEYVEITGTVDSAIAIEADAFTGTSGVTVVVNTAAEKGYFETALTTSGIEDVTVILFANYNKVAENAVVSGGFSVRMKGYTGLRALFSFDDEIAALNEYNGFTLVSYGVIASSYNRFANTYGSDEDAFFAAARQVTENEGSPIKFVPVYNADGTGANKYVDVATKTFCISLTGIPSSNYLSDVYMAGYAIWKDASGKESYTITTYDMADGMKAVNLYEITLGLTKTGIINSENTDDLCFWQILKCGALKTNSFNTANDSTTKGYTLPADGYYTYADVDWHAFTGNTSTDGYGFNPTGVDTAASGVVWSVLKYTDDEYVLILRNKDKSTYTELTLPQYSANTSKYLLYAPYDYRYGNASKIGSATLVTYNPALTQTDYNKIKTMVVDHGITATGAAAFSGLSKVETIVYPNGLSGAGNYKFIGSSSVKNVIWCHTDENGVPVEHLSEFDGLKSLFDLRGFDKLDINVLLRGCSSVENVILSSSVSSTHVESIFYGTTALKRAWSDGNAMPAEGTVDMTATKLQRLGKGVFGVGSNIHTIKLPSTIKEIYQTFVVTNTDNTCWYIFGQDKTINYVCTDAVAELIAGYVAYIRANPRTALPATGSAADNITVNGKSVLKLIEELGLE